MLNNIKTALVLAPHTDDGELGCGGTIAKLIEQGTRVHLAAFSPCRKSVPEGFDDDVLIIEQIKAAKVLGIATRRVIQYEFEVREFPSLRQEICEELVVLKRKLNPDVIFTPLSNDIHQDHKTIAEEAIRVFKESTILQYEMPWNNLSFSSDCFISIEKRHLDKKQEAINTYTSQRHRFYANKDFFISLATVRGKQINRKYAEAFSVVRWIMD